LLTFYHIGKQTKEAVLDGGYPNYSIAKMQCRLCFDAWCAVLGVDSEFCNVEALVTGIVDNWPDQLLKHRRKFTGKDDLHLCTVFCTVTFQMLT
jgi:hypothetical protein